MVKILSRDDILAAHDIQIKQLDVPEWGGMIFVKTLSADERDMLEAQIVEMSSNGKPRNIRMEHLRASLAVLGICDEEGHALFKMSDVHALGKKSAAALDRVVVEIQNMSAMTPQDIEALTVELKNDQRVALPIA